MFVEETDKKVNLTYGLKVINVQFVTGYMMKWKWLR